MFRDEGTTYSRKTIADIEIEAPNLDKVAQRSAQLDRLREVGLAEAGIARARDEGEERLGEVCGEIRWLDLSGSLLPDWEEVSLITGELKGLRTLLLHKCRLAPPPNPLPSGWGERLGHLEDLRLGGTQIGWGEIVRLAPAIEGLKHLQLGSNALTHLEGGEGEPGVLPNLISLSLEDNKLSFWADVMEALARLPSLESLNLNHNNLSPIPSAPVSARKLNKLKELHLRGNSIDSWIDLENINTWLSVTGLEALHISTLPSPDAEEEEEVREEGLLGKYEYRDFRAVLIARLPHLRVLDKTEISAKERRDAELFVYTRFREGDPTIINGRGGGEKKLNLTTEEKVKLFPRYMELAKRFDGDTPPDLGREVKKEKNTLRSKMVSLTVIASDTAPGDAEGGVKGEGVKVQMLTSTPLRLAKIKLANAVGVKSVDVGQIWVLLKGEGGEERIVIELDDLSRNLDWYEVSSGDQLVLVTRS